MALRLRAALAAAALAGAVAACSGSPSGSPSPSAASAGASPAGEATTETCAPIDLLTPSGEPVDLTGTWQGDDLALYQVRQLGECVWLIGQNGTYTYVFQGRLQGDFGVVGRWAVIAASDHLIGDIVNRGRFWIGTGTATLQIEQGTDQATTLAKHHETVDPQYSPEYPIALTTWTRVDDEPDHPFPSP